MYQIISGGIMALSWVLAFMFFLYWKKTHDRLFMAFALSFGLMGIERLILGLYSRPNEAEPSFYILRLSAYLLIVFAILDKNRAKRKIR